MANLVVGRVRRMDTVEGVIVLGHIKFRLAEGLPLSRLTVGTRVMATYEERDGRYWITECRLNDELPADALQQNPLVGC